MNGKTALISLVLLAFLAAFAWLFSSVSGPSLRVSEVMAEVVPEGVLISARIENSGAPDVLGSVASADTKFAKIIGITESYEAIVPGGGAAILASDGAYVLLEGVEGALVEGRMFPVELYFENNGLTRVKARLGPGSARHVGRGMAADMAVALEVQPDGDGWKIRVETQGFSFREPFADMVHEPGFGHAHLYLNGVKLMRMYGPEARVGQLPPGAHILRVSLNTNTHMVYMAEDQPVAAETVVTVK